MERSIEDPHAISSERQNMEGGEPSECVRRAYVVQRPRLEVLRTEAHHGQARSRNLWRHYPIHTTNKPRLEARHPSP